MEKRFYVLPAIVSGILLLMAMGGWPYEFYIFVRWVVFLSSLYTAFWALKVTANITAYFVIGIGVLFNPILPFTLSFNAWRLFDFIAAGVFGWAVFSVLAHIRVLNRVIEIVTQSDDRIQHEPILTSQKQGYANDACENPNLASIPEHINETQQNPALQYVLDNSDLHSSWILGIAKTIYEMAEKSAFHLSQSTSTRMTNNLVHLFYDFYICSLLGPLLQRLGSKTASAMIDALHIEHYGLPSEIIITGGIIQLITLRDTDFACFYRTFLAGDIDWLCFANFANYCIDKNHNGGLFEIRAMGQKIANITREPVRIIQRLC